MPSLNSTIRSSYLRKFGREAEPEVFYSKPLKELVGAYGQRNVIAAFDDWLASKNSEDRVTIGSFIKSATGSLHDEYTEETAKQEIRKENVELDTLCVFMAKIGGASNAPDNRHRPILNELLYEFPRQEIEDAYRLFLEGKDDYDKKFALKNFCGGAGRIIILTEREKAKVLADQEKQILAATEAERLKAEQQLVELEEPEEGL